VDYLSVPEFALKHGVSKQRVLDWLHGGRLPGAHKVGSRWIVPSGADPGVQAAGRPAAAENLPYREFEAKLLDVCAGPLDTVSWRKAGPARLMAGLAVVIASDSKFDRRAYLDLARSLDSSMVTDLPAFTEWLSKSPVQPSRFMPMLRELVKHRKVYGDSLGVLV
jgi:hypothetical protein